MWVVVVGVGGVVADMCGGCVEWGNFFQDVGTNWQVWRLMGDGWRRLDGNGLMRAERSPANVTDFGMEIGMELTRAQELQGKINKLAKQVEACAAEFDVESLQHGGVTRNELQSIASCIRQGKLGLATVVAAGWQA